MRLPELKLRVSESNIGHIPKKISHQNIEKLIRSGIVKYTYPHKDIQDDQVIKKMIKDRVVDLTAFKLQYVKDEIFAKIRTGTRDQYTARKSSTDPDF